MQRTFSQSQIEAIAKALADTSEGLSGSEIGHLLQVCQMADTTPTMTKWKRLHNAFVESQNKRRDRAAILAFIRKAMKPELYAKAPEHYEVIRANLNRALAFASLSVEASGTLVKVEKANTLADAERRAQDLRADLVKRNVHPDVLKFCKAELLADNYFHAVLEASKSIAAKLRSRTGLTDDGSTLVDLSLGGEKPVLAINALKTESERSEQRGFANLLKGTFGMFRNTTAHEARVLWVMDKADAEDLLSLASLIHRRLDKAVMPPRV
jgi:uncharacterized protein (TIGR02391 family)